MNANFTPTEKYICNIRIPLYIPSRYYDFIENLGTLGLTGSNDVWELVTNYPVFQRLPFPFCQMFSISNLLVVWNFIPERETGSKDPVIGEIKRFLIPLGYTLTFSWGEEKRSTLSLGQPGFVLGAELGKKFTLVPQK